MESSAFTLLPKVATALRRLQAELPLLAGLQALGDGDAALYCQLLRSYLEHGQPQAPTLAAIPVDDTRQALQRLADSHLIVLDAGGEPRGVYPFTSEAREHRVTIDRRVVHCMCALDALAVSSMFDRSVVVDSVCRVSGAAIHLVQQGVVFCAGTLDAWFGLDWGAADSDLACADSLCLEMNFLASEDIAKRWLAASPETREIFDLQAAAGFAAAFFVPLVEHCRQRNPAGQAL